MDEVRSSRTLVKSPPELWAVCSDAALLGRHLEQFGEITITRLEPETTVAWEGERASGTVRIEPAGWGTRVTMTAQPLAPVPPPAPGPPQVRAPATRTRRRLFGWLAELLDAREPSGAAEEPEPEPRTGATDGERAALDAALASLGQAHRRPFTHG